MQSNNSQPPLSGPHLAQAIVTFKLVSQKLLAGQSAVFFVGNTKTGLIQGFNISDAQLASDKEKFALADRMKKYAAETEADFYMSGAYVYVRTPSENGNPMKTEERMIFVVESPTESWTGSVSESDFKSGKANHLPAMDNGPLTGIFNQIVWNSNEKMEDHISCTDTTLGRGVLDKIASSNNLKLAVLNLHKEIHQKSRAFTIDPLRNVIHEIYSVLDDISGQDIWAKGSAGKGNKLSLASVAWLKSICKHLEKVRSIRNSNKILDEADVGEEITLSFIDLLYRRYLLTAAGDQAGQEGLRKIVLNAAEEIFATIETWVRDSAA